MNESQFTQSIIRQLKKSGVYCLKIQTMLNNGVPDLWCSGPKGSLWLEMKYRKDVPKKDSTFFFPGLSQLQDSWLTGRYNEGRKVAVVLGSPIGCCMYHMPRQWKEGINRNNLEVPKLDVIEWIKQQTLG